MSAWEQWGGKKPASGGLQTAQDAFQNLLRSSPLSTASTASTDSDASGSYSLKKMWDSARDLTKVATNGIVPASGGAKDAADALESGQCEEPADEAAAARWPLWRKNSNAQNGLIPTMSCCLILGNYVFVVLSSVLQLMTLGSFALSAFPGGNSSLKAFGALFWKSARGMIQAIARLFR
ncbi:hypothetical protein BBJ29_000513 [Phytophthora kernoviae]|uniref:Vesicle transport protein n=1 Tax=Phytophthora kernoviae TaxID=325452 RepID=A0A3F2RYB3_9STRA|nr:hypothetical protein BBJ29_000513 [Phytophthora kernoviae]RLN66631.1 hypothetical protein BBP00_00002093 [Phytophthora kernoviae]